MNFLFLRDAMTTEFKNFLRFLKENGYFGMYIKEVYGLGNQKRIDSLKHQQETFSYFLDSSFCWEWTTQGDDFWRNIYNKLKREKK